MRKSSSKRDHRDAERDSTQQHKLHRRNTGPGDGRSRNLYSHRLEVRYRWCEVGNLLLSFMIPVPVSRGLSDISRLTVVNQSNGTPWLLRFLDPPLPFV